MEELDATDAPAVPAGPLEVNAPALWPLRALALAGAVAQAFDDYSSDRWQLLFATLLIGAYALVVTIRPVPYRDDARVRLQIVCEQAFHTFLVLLTGAWPSPFALCLIPTGMLAGFAIGTVFAAQLAAASVIVISVQHIAEEGVRAGLQASALWASLLGLVAFTSGLSHRAALDAARQHRMTLVRVNRLAEANSLLFALQRLAQTMPASLDLDEVVDSTFARIESIMPAGSVAVYLLDDTGSQLVLYRQRGSRARPTLADDEIPPSLRAALGAPRTLRAGDLAPGLGVSADARSGIYTALRARGQVTGALVVESDQVDAFTQQHVEIVHGLAEAFGISIDNARLFRRLRTVAADEERGRIARDLHDQVGSSLAFLGFEIDRAQGVAERGDDVGPVLAELRVHLTDVIKEVREKLSDLRTDVTDARDLGATVREHLGRIEQRSGLGTELRVHTEARPPRRQEHELWQITLEALTNVERHAQAHQVLVEYAVTSGRVRLRITDDGVGVDPAKTKLDRYGMVGMRERAESIGARLQIGPNQPKGTAVTVELDLLDEVPV